MRSFGATTRPVLYRDEAVRDIRDELLSFDAVLVWVNPLDISGDRSVLDPMLREVAACGVVVSAHPDVIAKIGVKEVLYTTRSMEWGSDVDRYVDAEGLRARFPEHLAAGPRVLKPNYGNGGRNVWRVQLDEAGNAPALKTSVKVGRVRQCGVELGVASGLHFQAALGVICSGCASSIIGVARAAMPSICM